MKTKSKPVLLSGVQPSGTPMIGNYVGALRNWIQLQKRYDCLFLLVDLHALNVAPEPRELREKCYDLVALYLACGIDPQENTIFIQSHVPQHSELTTVLNCCTYVGELRRMTQFKEKALKHPVNVNAGLLDYPVLMAADILLHGTDLVPVGDDQRQHLELARHLARRFNEAHGEVFTVPEVFVPDVGARIMSLQDPTRKMDKSDPNPANIISLLDPPDEIRRKIRQAVTDSGSEIACREDKPGVTNLLVLLSCATGRPIPELEDEYRGQRYGELKRDLGEHLVELLRPIRERYAQIRPDLQAIHAVLEYGAEKASARAAEMLTKIHDVLGLVPRAHR